MANVSSAADAPGTLPGTLVSWQEGIGDERRYHIAHVSPAGITLVLKEKDDATWKQWVAAATASPTTAAAMLQQLPKAAFLARGDLAKATHAPDLWQLSLVDRNQQRTKLPEGREQADVFAALKQHLGGQESEEEADAWSVMQSPLFVLAVFGTIGGFFIWFTTICEPNYVATGRRSGMKQLMNTIGYSIGLVWTSVAVGLLVAFILGRMIFQLIKRPLRQVLTYSS